jgi:EAL and modified HD-GYP domain-containing signal transduction protein
MLVDTYFARQPILDRRRNVCAYEVLYRSGPDSNAAGVVDGESATAQVLASAFNDIDLPDLLAGRPGFVNLPRETILERALLSFPPSRVAAEVLEDAEIDSSLIEAIRELRTLGYRVALDDFTLRDGRNGLLPFADIVKVDLQLLTPEELGHTASVLRSMGITLLAEKVETAEEFDQCARLGFELFQGYFFAKPELVSGRRLDEGRGRLVGLLAELHRPDITIDDVARKVEHHPSLSFQMLRLLNSASIGLHRQVESIREAVILLGTRKVTELASVLVLASHDHKPRELLTLGLSRARMCELIGERLGRHDPDSFFTVGIFSVLDALADRPIEEVVDALPLSSDVVDALVDRSGLKGRVLEAAIAYERAEWDSLPSIGIAAAEVSGAYLEAIDWASAMSKAVA